MVKKIKLKIIFLVLVGFLQISNSFVFGVGHPTDVEEEDVCSLCLVPLSQDGEGEIVIPGIRTLGCNHRFHEGCFQGLLNASDHLCPNCRAPHNIPLPERAQGHEQDDVQQPDNFFDVFFRPLILDITCEINNGEAFDELKQLILQHQQNGQRINLTLRFGRMISEIPEAFFENINNLVMLDLSRNKLRYLPDSIGNLTRLEGLDLGRNKLNSLPYSIRFLTNLNYINLSCNRFLFRPQFSPLVRLYFNEASQMHIINRIRIGLGIAVITYKIIHYLKEKMAKKRTG